MVAVGIRVVRGPDWSGGDRDGGEGHLGTVTSYAEDKTCTVVWDNGNITISSAGKENNFDLRIFDNGPTGVRHKGKDCDGCGENGIIGIRWSCKTCEDLHLCSLCYFMGKHDRPHDFVRYDTAKSESCRVPSRFTTPKIPTYGIFPSAEVVRGTHWNQGDKDGGPGKTGTVIGIINHDSKSYRSAVTVSWETGETTTCRVGHQGQVDVQCIQPGQGPQCYPHHLPVLDAAVVKLWNELDAGKKDSSSKTKFKKGDAVRILDDKETVQRLQKDHGGWDSSRTRLLGKVGKVVEVKENGDLMVRLGLFPVCFNPACCLPTSKSDLPSDPLGFKGLFRSENSGKGSSSKTKFEKGRMVRILDEEETVKRLQENHGRWEDNMTKFLGNVGKVVKVLDNGDLVVRFGSSQLIFNPACCLPASNSGFKEISDIESMNALANMSAIEKMGVSEFLPALEKSDVGEIRKILDKYPFLMKCQMAKAVSILHIAADQGKPEVVELLLDKGANINARDWMGNTPIFLSFLKKNVDVAKFLIGAGADLEVVNKDGLTLLHIAVNAGNPLLVRDLMRRGCDVNAQDKDGDTPFHLAILKNEISCAEVLLTSTNLDLTITNEKGSNALHLVKLVGESGGKLETKILEKMKKSLDVKKPDVLTAHHNATLANNEQESEILIKEGADVNNKAGEKKTAEISSGSLLCCECFKREADFKCPSCNAKMMCSECAEVIKTCPVCPEIGEAAAPSSTM